MSERISREQFCEVIKSLCKRPKMYTQEGTFNEIVSFLEGYGGSRFIDEDAYHSVTTPFRKWVVYKFRCENPPPDEWEGVFPIKWSEFLKQFSSEADALSQLPILYDEYCGFRALIDR